MNTHSESNLRPSRARFFKQAIKKWIARILFSTGLLRTIGFLRIHLFRRPALIILCYHRITEDAFQISPQCVLLSDLENQAAFFSKQCDIWPLSNVLDYLEGDLRLRRDTVVFTFDDGYADNYEYAFPILKKYRIPATFFVAAEPLIDRKPYWFDQLADLLNRVGPDRIFPLSAGHPALSDLFETYRTDDVPGRKRIAGKIFTYLKNLPEEERARIIASFPGQDDVLSGRSEPPQSRMMTVEQILEMTREGYDIGGHSVTHPVFSKLDDRRLREEIEGALSALAGLGIKAATFAYPFGGLDDIGGAAPSFLAQSGIRLGVTAEERAVLLKDDPLLLPRKVISPQTIGQILMRLERLAWRV